MTSKSPQAHETITQLPTIPPRHADSHKGTFGRVLVVAGSQGMSGAAILCASAALRGGAGLVTLAVPDRIAAIVAGANPCYLTAALASDEDGRFASAAISQLEPLVQANDVIAIGPGLGRGPASAVLVRSLVINTRKPLVIDADGLNALVGQQEILSTAGRPLVLTPHPGEFARLLGVDQRTVQEARQDLALRFAAEHGIVLVLKGFGSIITDGRRIYTNTTGNPGLATGGTGDVLTGMIAALIGQGLEPFAAAQLGVHIHGLAGDLARDDLGEIALIASDLLDYLPRAFRKF